MLHIVRLPRRTSGCVDEGRGDQWSEKVESPGVSLCAVPGADSRGMEPLLSLLASGCLSVPESEVMERAVVDGLVQVRPPAYAAGLGLQLLSLRLIKGAATKKQLFMDASRALAGACWQGTNSPVDIEEDECLKLYERAAWIARTEGLSAAAAELKDPCLTSRILIR
jgi:hypothetical protein